MEKEERQDRFARIRGSIKKLKVVSRNSMIVEAKQQKIRSRRQSLQLAMNNFQSERLLRKFSDQDEQEERNMTNSFDEKYRLLEKIGEGGNAVVFTCEYIPNGKIYAVKMVRMDEEHYLELKRNFLSINQLKHTNIIRYHALYFDLKKHLAYLIMEYFPSKNLLEHNIKDENELKIIFTEVINAIVYLHERNICHRDIKPENILYDDFLKKLKIIDFGISKKTFQRGQRRDMLTIIGTYFYLAPQIFTGGGYDEKVDMWSVGVTLYKLITGITPFESEYHAETIENIVKGNIHFDSVWQKYSYFVKDLVARLLRPKEERLSAKQALRHLWINQGSPGKLRRGSQKSDDIKFARHDSGSERLKVFKTIEEESVNIHHATPKEEGSIQVSKTDEEPKVSLKANRLNLIENKQFELIDSSDEDTSPQTAKKII